MEYNFDGWDYIEVANALGWNIHDGPDDAEEMQQKMRDTWASGDRERLVDACRQYLKKLVEVETGYRKPVWEGLSKVTDDEAFINLFLTILPHLWT